MLVHGLISLRINEVELVRSSFTKYTVSREFSSLNREALYGGEHFLSQRLERLCREQVLVTAQPGQLCNAFHHVGLVQPANDREVLNRVKAVVGKCVGCLPPIIWWKWMKGVAPVQKNDHLEALQFCFLAPQAVAHSTQDIKWIAQGVQSPDIVIDQVYKSRSKPQGSSVSSQILKKRRTRVRKTHYLKETLSHEVEHTMTKNFL